MKLDIQIDDQDLPVLSTVASQAIKFIQDPKITNQKMEDLICQDPSLAARVLRAANSPFYSGRMLASTISDAIFRLGMRNLRNVIVVAASGEFFSDNDPIVQYLWDHSVSTAMASNFLADFLNFNDVSEVFIAGLLHDIGKLIIYRQHPAVYGPLVERAMAQQGQLHLLEEENFNYFNHMAVGGLVIRKWKLHESIAETARFHHDLDEEIPICVNHERIVCLVSLANRLSNMAATTQTPDDLPPAAGVPYIQALRMTDKKLHEAAAILFERLRGQRIDLT